MTKTSLHAFKAKDTRFVADWLKSKDLHKLCSVFEGIQEPFILSLACKSVVSFRSIIKATEKFPGGGAFDHLEWTCDGAFEQLFGLGRGQFEQKVSKNSNIRGVARGGMLKLRFDWYITSNKCLYFFLFLHVVSVKLPQIIKVLQASSVEGLSLLSFITELITMTGTFSYSSARGFPFR